MGLNLSVALGFSKRGLSMPFYLTNPIVLVFNLPSFNKHLSLLKKKRERQKGFENEQRESKEVKKKKGEKFQLKIPRGQFLGPPT
jgi:hypothetical protein